MIEPEEFTTAGFDSHSYEVLRIGLILYHDCHVLERVQELSRQGVYRIAHCVFKSLTVYGTLPIFSYL